LRPFRALKRRGINSDTSMKWVNATISFLFVAFAAFILVGWFLLPHAEEPPNPQRPISILTTVPWWRNWLGYPVALGLAGLSAWSIIRKTK
jgi:hypothetical protein